MSLPPRHRDRAGQAAIALWLAFLLVCGLLIGRAHFSTDLSAFLPAKPTPAQQLLIDQLRDGLASRLLLVAVEGADATERARLSQDMAQRLRIDSQFVRLNNGEASHSEGDRAFLFAHRYLLSPAVTPAHFSSVGLRAAINDSLDLLASPAGLLVKSLLPRDPTGDMLALLEQLDNGQQPRLQHGVWAAPNGERALLLLQTRAAGSDTDAQQRAVAAIQQAFAATAGTTTTARLLLTGPGVFSVNARAAIQSQVTRLSLLSMLLIAGLLLLVYRSIVALALGFLPVLSGALAGVAAVSLGFGSVHGITLGFGTALIGEAVDYSVYLFVQSEQGGAQGAWIERFWPTVRLGVVTSVVGFAVLLGSGFPGLAQLGLYAIAGLISAAAVTRYVLPTLLPAQFRIRDISPLGRQLATLCQRASALRWPALALLLAASAVLLLHRSQLLDDSITSLSPVPAADLALDQRLRADLGAPDARYLVLITAATQEAALQGAEQASAVLQQQVELGRLARFDSPSRYLPSRQTQQLRLASLPDPNELQARLNQALQDLPLRAAQLAPFVADVASARSQPLLQATDLATTSMAMALDALLLQQGQRWTALLPLTTAPDTPLAAASIGAALRSAGLAQALLLDIKAESDHLYAGYLHEVIALSLAGLLAIVVLLLLTLRSALRVLRVMAPLLAAVITVLAGLALAGQALMLLHLVGLLLVVAVGSNYALFFDRPDAALAGAAQAPVAPRTLASMLIANLTTVAGFGLLAFSKIALLQALGVTVAPGVILALFYAAVFAQTRHD